MKIEDETLLHTLKTVKEFTEDRYTTKEHLISLLNKLIIEFSKPNQK
jgi:hypothetical protein